MEREEILAAMRAAKVDILRRATARLLEREESEKSDNEALMAELVAEVKARCPETTDEVVDWVSDKLWDTLMGPEARFAASRAPDKAQLAPVRMGRPIRGRAPRKMPPPAAKSWLDKSQPPEK